MEQQIEILKFSIIPIFDINRDGSKVISFSVGIHICLGRELAARNKGCSNAIKNRF